MKAAFILFLFLSLFGLNFSLSRKHFLVNKRVTWSDAQKYCRANYDDLSIFTVEEKQTLCRNATIDSYFCWIGLYRSPDNTIKWIWSGGEDEKIGNWDVGEPSPEGEVCALVNKSECTLKAPTCFWHLPFYCMLVFPSILVSERMTWDEALNHCRRHHIDLVSLRSQAIMAEVMSVAKYTQTAQVWIGLRFIAGGWIWTNGDDLQYKAWSSQEELQCPARNLRCGALDREKNIWNPRNCEEKLSFVCLGKP